MTTFWQKASWAKMMSDGGQTNTAALPPNQKIKQSRVTNLSLYEDCKPIINNFPFRMLCMSLAGKLKS
jgi:hypothetical protein